MQLLNFLLLLPQVEVITNLFLNVAELKPKLNFKRADSTSSFLCIGTCSLSTNKFILDMNMDTHRVHQDLWFWLEIKIT